MTDPDDFAALRAALEAGPQHERNWLRDGATVYELTQKGAHLVNRWSASVQSSERAHELSASEKEALATYIAAANPEVIARLLAELDAAKSELQRQRDLLSVALAEAKAGQELVDHFAAAMGVKP